MPKKTLVLARDPSTEVLVRELPPTAAGQVRAIRGNRRAREDTRRRFIVDSTMFRGVSADARKWSPMVKEAVLDQWFSVAPNEFNKLFDKHKGKGSTMLWDLSRVAPLSFVAYLRKAVF